MTPARLEEIVRQSVEVREEVSGWSGSTFWVVYTRSLADDGTLDECWNMLVCCNNPHYAAALLEQIQSAVRWALTNATIDESIHKALSNAGQRDLAVSE